MVRTKETVADKCGSIKENIQRAGKAYEDEQELKYVNKQAKKAAKLLKGLQTQYVFAIFHRFCADRAAVIQSEMLEYSEHEDLQELLTEMNTDMELSKKFMSGVHINAKKQENDWDKLIAKKGL